MTIFVTQTEMDEMERLHQTASGTRLYSLALIQPGLPGGKLDQQNGNKFRLMVMKK